MRTFPWSFLSSLPRWSSHWPHGTFRFERRTCCPPSFLPWAPPSHSLFATRRLFGTERTSASSYQYTPSPTSKDAMVPTRRTKQRSVLVVDEVCNWAIFWNNSQIRLSPCCLNVPTFDIEHFRSNETDKTVIVKSLLPRGKCEHASHENFISESTYVNKKRVIFRNTSNNLTIDDWICCPLSSSIPIFQCHSASPSQNSLIWPMACSSSPGQDDNFHPLQSSPPYN